MASRYAFFAIVGGLAACSPDTSGSGMAPETPDVTALFQGLRMISVIDTEPGLSAQTRTSFSNPYHNGHIDIVTLENGSVVARTAYVEEIGLSAYGDLPLVGGASMAGSYKILSTENIARAGGVTSYDVSTLEGPITVDVNFVTGAVTANSSALDVTATITGRDMAGTATHNGVTGALTGKAGSDAILSRNFIYGLFQGADAAQGKAFSGGIKAHSGL